MLRGMGATLSENSTKTKDVEGVESVSDAAPYGRGTWDLDWDRSRLALGSSAEILFQFEVPYSRVGPVILSKCLTPNQMLDHICGKKYRDECLVP